MQDLREIRLLSIKMIMDSMKAHQMSVEWALNEANKIASYIERGKMPEKDEPKSSDNSG